MSDIKKVSIHTKLPVKALVATLQDYLNYGEVDNAKMTEYLAGYFTGDYARHRAELHFSAVIPNSPINAFLKENAKDILEALSHQQSAAHICFALLCARYEFVYDIAVAFASYFRLQDEISNEALYNAIGKQYGLNDNVKRALARVVYYMVEAQIIGKPANGTYTQNEPLAIKYPIVEKLWQEAYFVNVPLANKEELDELPFEPFFRYLKLLPDVNF